MKNEKSRKKLIIALRKVLIISLAIICVIALCHQLGRAFSPSIAAEQTADYSEVNSAVNKAMQILEQKDVYSQNSLYKLQGAVDAVVYGLDLQAEVNRYGQQVNSALESLKFKNDDMTATFDEDNIVMRIGSFSDTHTDLNAGTEKFTKALKNLKIKAGNNAIDMILLGGDLIDMTHYTGQNTEIKKFKALLEAEIDVSQTSIFYTLGNHDMFDKFSLKTGMNSTELIKLYTDVFLEGDTFENSDYFKHDIDHAQIAKGNRHAVLKNYHFLSVAVETNCSSDSSTLTWLDNTLRSITEENAEQYVFVVTHMPPYDTIHGSTVGVGARTYNGNIDSVLKKYPQVITLSGHMHADINQSKSIMQDNYTSIDMGSTNYFYTPVAGPVTESGGYLPLHNLGDTEQYSQFGYIEIDANGNVRYTRIDNYNDTEIGEPWILKVPDEQGYHLESYGRYRYYDYELPHFEPDDEIYIEQTSYSSANLVFDAATGDDIWYYSLIVTRASDNSVLSTLYLTANVFLTGYDFLPEKIDVNLSGYDFNPDEQFKIKIISYTIWNTMSDNALEYIFTPNDGLKKTAYYVGFGGENSIGFGYGNNISPVPGDKYLSLAFKSMENQDPYIYFDINSWEIPLSINTYVALRVKTNIGANMNAQFMPLSTTQTSVSPMYNVTFKNTTDWQTVYVSLFEPRSGSASKLLKGDLTMFRIDLFNNSVTDYLTIRSNSYFYIDSLSFFELKNDAAAYNGLDNAPPSPVLNNIVYRGDITEGSVLDGNLLMADTNVKGNFTFSRDKIVKPGINSYMWFFLPDDIEQYRMIKGSIELHSEKIEGKIYNHYIDMTDPQNAYRYHGQNNVSVNLANGYLNAAFNVGNVLDPYFIIDVENDRISIRNYRYVAFRIKTNMTQAMGQVLLISSASPNYHAVQNIVIKEHDGWQTVYIDITKSDGFNDLDYINSDYVSIRFDWFDANNGDYLNIKKGDYFCFDSVVFSSIEMDSAQYKGILSVTPKLRNIKYDGDTMVNTPLSAELLSAVTNVEGRFEFVEADSIFKGQVCYKYLFIPNNRDFISISGTIEIEAKKIVPVITDISYSGAAVAGQELNSQLLHFVSDIKGTVAFKGIKFVDNTYGYTYIFTPEDKLTYESVSGIIVLTAKSVTKVNNVIYSGSKIEGSLLDASKLLASMNTDGVFTLAGTEVLAGLNEYTWTFTPTNTDKYTTVTGTVTIQSSIIETNKGCNGDVKPYVAIGISAFIFLLFIFKKMKNNYIK